VSYGRFPHRPVSVIFFENPFYFSLYLHVRTRVGSLWLLLPLSLPALALGGLLPLLVIFMLLVITAHLSSVPLSALLRPAVTAFSLLVRSEPDVLIFLFPV